MMPRRRRAWVPWAVYAGAALLVLEVLGWSSWRIVVAEREQRATEARAAFEQRTRLALWRMDSTVVPLLARESARDWSVAPAGATDPADPVRLRAGFRSGEGFSATGSVGGGTDAVRIERDLAALARLLSDDVVVRTASRSFAGLGDRLTTAAIGSTDVAGDAAGDGAESLYEFGTRTRVAKRALDAPFADAPEAARRVGTFTPVWVGGGAGGGGGGDVEPELVLVRGVEAAAGAHAEVLWINWPRLRGTLLSEAAPLVPGIGLVPRVAGEAAGPEDLATLPVRAVRPALTDAGGGVSAATVVSLVATWCAAVTALVAIGVVLYISRRLAAQRWRFAAAVTHELRTPLTGLRLSAELAQRAANDDDRRRRAGEVVSQARRLSGIVESVLAYARVGSGSADPVRRAHVSACVAAVVSDVAAAAEAHGVVVEVESVPDAVVVFDAVTLERIVGNLLENAVRHAAGRVRVSGGAVGEEIVLRVSDDGPGVPRSERRRVFRAFESGLGSGVRGEDAAGGLGLGLALVRELVRGGGGRVRVVEGEPGEVFEVTLPVADG